MADAGGRWRHVEDLYERALALPADERQAFLDRTCSDAETRREVETLLDCEDVLDDFLERPALQELALEIAAGARTLIGRTIGGYRVDALLGSGGMGDVYQARDLKLERNVALKVLAHEGGLGAADVRRFIDEARAASVLSHPNIVTVHAVGRADDVAYIAMELVQGRTLRAVITDGPVAIDAALDVAIQLAEALAAAHDAGVIHRDLKPENVMVTSGGLVKVLDFGIARRKPSMADGAVEPAGDPALPGTDSALVLGTVGYMSPEQAAGSVVDARSDQFSFGAIVYEMLSGRRAFQRATRAESLAAILVDLPPPLTGSGLAPAWRSLEVCLHKAPEQRYATMHQVADGFRSLRQSRQHPVGMWSRRAWLASAASAVVAAAGYGMWGRWGSRRYRGRLAVLPFLNTQSDENAQYLCKGLADSLVRRLKLIDDLHVTGPSAILPSRLPMFDLRAVGRAMNVDAVLTGTLARRGGRLLVTAEVVSVENGAVLWENVFSRAQDDVLAMHDEIAASIVRDAIGVSPETGAEDHNRVMTADPRAYDLFLQGVHNFRLQHEEGYLAARHLLREAIEHDPSFALAHVTLASSYSVMTIDGYEAPHEAWQQASEQLALALAIDPELPDAHAEAAAPAFFQRWDWAAADREWAAAIASDRDEVQAELLGSRALQSWALSRIEEAMTFARAARQVDPLSSSCVVREADLLAWQRQFDAAAVLYEDAMRNDPDDPRAYFGLAEVRRHQGRYDEAMTVRQRGRTISDPEAVLPPERGAAGYVAIERQDAAASREGLALRAASGAYVSPLDIGRLEARLGNSRLALGSLEAAFEERSPGLVFLRVDPAWEAVRTEPQFMQAMRRVGLGG